MLDLFADAEPWQEPLAAGAVILHRFAFNAAEQLIRDINDVASQSPFRQMVIVIAVASNHFLRR